MRTKIYWRRPCLPCWRDCRGGGLVVVDGHTCLPDKYLCKRHTHALCGRPSVAVHFNSIQPTSPQSLPCRSFLKKFHPFNFYEFKCLFHQVECALTLIWIDLNFSWILIRLNDIFALKKIYFFFKWLNQLGMVVRDAHHSLECAMEFFEFFPFFQNFLKNFNSIFFALKILKKL